jgi:hypothetical protein
MKHLYLLALLILLAPIAVKAQQPACDPTLQQHVYRPSRLTVKTACITVSGTVVAEKSEKDGDIHMRVRLDPKFTNLLNKRNTEAQGGNLVVEPICVKPVTQKSAIKACKDFQQPIKIPVVGNRVVVTGVYVHDTEANHGWMEIHPATTIQIVRPPHRSVHPRRRH